MNDQVYVHDSATLDKIGILEGFLSFQWERRFQEPGAFELKIQGIAQVIPEQLIRRETDIGVIESVKKSYAEQTGHQTTIKGRFLSCYAERRIVPGVKTISGTREQIMKQLVAENMTDSAGADRAFPFLSVEADHEYSSEIIVYQKENAKLLDELETQAGESGLGFAIQYVNKALVFDVLRGLDRTASQSVNPKAKFSIEFENLLTQEYTVDTMDKTNFAYITMPEAGEDAELSTTYGDAIGRERREIFVAGSNVRKDENGDVNTTEIQLKLLQAEGGAELEDEQLTFTATIDPKGSLEYKADYDLGDIVTIIAADYGVQLDTRIIKIREIIENGSEKLKVTFGYDNTKFKKFWR